MTSRIFIASVVCVILVFGFPIATVPLLETAIELVTGVEYMNPDSVVGSVGILAYFALAAMTFAVLVVCAGLAFVYQRHYVAQFLSLAGIEVIACIIGYLVFT